MPVQEAACSALLVNTTVTLPSVPQVPQPTTVPSEDWTGKFFAAVGEMGLAPFALSVTVAS